MSDKRTYLWDLPTRFFHWLLVICVVGAVVTGQIGGNLIDWHGRLGLAIVGLLVFRLVWGLIGSTYARFLHFFPTPAKLRAYLKGDWRGLGHNPLGAFSVFGLLGLLAVQVATGVFSNDDIAFTGPLSDLVSKTTSNILTGWHKQSSNFLIALVVLHLGAIIFYVRVKKENLVKPMITGWKEDAQEQDEPARGGGALAFVIALLLALAAVYGASGAWLPEPVAVPAAEVPSW